MSGAFKERLAPIIANMQNEISHFGHGTRNRYTHLVKGARVSEHDQLSLDMKKGSFKQHRR